jgi:hypothetical protein
MYTGHPGDDVTGSVSAPNPESAEGEDPKWQEDSRDQPPMYH